jgi:UDP-N-acetylglucosamine--N-acetylmuramyl-(pentapeptide) pyrophosphoryl-undecaprenol N-acetylglucosamine transferase
MAALFGIPTVVQEQNSYPGITNKMLATKAKVICVAYENLERFFPKHKIVLTGNPVRQDLLTVGEKKSEALSHFKLDTNKKTLLILGGSLGARRVNQLIEKELESILAQNIQVIWQCGKLYINDYQKHNQKNVQVLAYIERMDLVYAAADVVVSRAGASSVSELCIVGKPVIYIPSPNVAEDHQTKNAQAIVDKNAAILIREKDLETQFSVKLQDLFQNEALQNELATNSKKMAKPNATKDIVNQIIPLLS